MEVTLVECYCAAFHTGWNAGVHTYYRGHLFPQASVGLVLSRLVR